jgi:hypothetical protein
VQRSWGRSGPGILGELHGIQASFQMVQSASVYHCVLWGIPNFLYLGENGAISSKPQSPPGRKTEVLSEAPGQKDLSLTLEPHPPAHFLSLHTFPGDNLSVLSTSGPHLQEKEDTVLAPYTRCDGTLMMEGKDT